MSKLPVVVSLGLAACLAAVVGTPACGRRGEAPLAPVPIGSIKELMDGIVDPTADVLFDAVSYDITAAGIAETKPQSRREWAEIRRHALLLAEASNLLKMAGRRVAPAQPFLKREPDEPSPEDLTPEQVQALIDEDPAALTRLAQGLADAAMLALKAADAQSVDGLFEAGDAIDKACENCHLKYWYPKDKKPALDALKRKK